MVKQAHISGLQNPAMIPGCTVAEDQHFNHYILTTKVDNNQSLYEEILSEPWFNNNQVPDFVNPKNVLTYIKDIILK